MREDVTDAISKVASAFEDGLDAAKKDARGDYSYYEGPMVAARLKFRDALAELVEAILGEE
jgi:hypothetical protein